MDGKLDKPFVLITKLDSDDMLSRDAIKEIQLYQLRERGGLIYEKGYVLFHESPSFYRRIKWEIGKFITKYVKIY